LRPAGREGRHPGQKSDGWVTCPGQRERRADPHRWEDDRVTVEVPLRIRWVKGHPVPAAPDECEPHTESPDDYLPWHAWAERMDKTHTQRQCRGCGLWAIWKPREVQSPAG
jgi:hypothetical protein